MIGRTAANAAVVTLPAAAPVIWDFLGFRFEAGPLVVGICATLMTRVIVTLNAKAPRGRLGLDIIITMLCTMVTMVWVQAHSLSLLQAGVSGIFFGALGVGIISFAKSQAATALRVGMRAAFRTLDSAEPPPADQRQLLHDIDAAEAREAAKSAD